MTDRQTASRVARSLALGGGDLVDAIASTGVEAWARTALTPAGGQGDATSIAPPALDLPDPPRSGASREDKQAYRKRLAAGTDELTRWWLRELVATPRPALERMTFGWHDHFATSSRKVRDPRAMLAQNHALRAHSLGSFDDLARAMAEDPALLHWLDAVRSTPQAPNENLAREFMELFCLGVDNGYTEDDVKAGALALTGWRATRGEATVTWDPRRHAPEPVTLFGVTGPLDAKGFTDAVLAQRQGDGYIATRWWRRLVTADPPAGADLDRLLRAYGPGRDIAALVTAMATSDQMSTAGGTLVVEPVVWVAGAARALRTAPDDPAMTKLAAALRRLGQLPFHPPSVGGWPSGRAWLSTSGLTTRREVAALLVGSGTLGPVSSAGPTARVDATAHLLGIPSFGSRSRALLDRLSDDPAALVTAALVAPESLVI